MTRVVKLLITAGIAVVYSATFWPLACALKPVGWDYLAVALLSVVMDGGILLVGGLIFVSVFWWCLWIADSERWI